MHECKAFAEKNDIQILRKYIDREMSAKTDNHLESQKIIKDSVKQQFETVIVWKSTVLPVIDMTWHVVRLVDSFVNSIILYDD